MAVSVTGACTAVGVAVATACGATEVHRVADRPAQAANDLFGFFAGEGFRLLPIRHDILILHLPGDFRHGLPDHSNSLISLV